MGRFQVSPHRISIFAMLALILATIWLRVGQFPFIPPAFNYDEAYNAVDALWLWEPGSTGTVYLPGNTGRQALFHWLLAVSMQILGTNIFAVRFVSVVIGILTVALMYRWVVTMLAEEPHRYTIAVIAAAGLAFSFWHITLSRTGFRASLLHLLFIMMAYFFWLGWRRQSIAFIIASGVALGLTQYTYWLAGLLPVHIGLFALGLSLLALKKASPSNPTPPLKKIWLWIGLMAVASLLVFIPLGITYLTDPTALGYVSQSSIFIKIAAGERSLPVHLLNSVRIFFDGPAGLWQGETGQLFSFDWLALAGFWLGLFAALKQWSKPAYLFLLVGLVVLWLPAPLNDIDFSDLRLPAMLPVHHAISNLRVAGVLPIYYTFVALGVMTGLQWAGHKLVWLAHPVAAQLSAFVLVVLVSGGINSSSFFFRWPQEPFLFERYNGPELALARELVRESRSKDILLPFHLYAHPTMHFFFDPLFAETDVAPLQSSHQSAIVVTTPEDRSPTAYMWLVRPTETEPGRAFLTSAQNVDSLLQLTTAQSLQRYQLAAPLLYPAQSWFVANLAPAHAQLTETPPVGRVDYNWNNQVQLVGYQITPKWARPGEPVYLTLHWLNLVDQPLTHNIFVHVINSRGQGVGQIDGLELTNGHRWRAGKITPTHHPLPSIEQPDPGPYLIRLGLFNTRTGNRIDVIDSDGNILGDQAIFGLFYVSTQDQFSTEPKVPIQAALGQQIQLLGHNLLPGQMIELPQRGESTLDLKIYWRTTRPVVEDYTIFVQLLDEQNQLITGFDTQPLGGNYPTTRWQPNEVVIEQIPLSLPVDDIASGTYRLVTGMYNFETGQRLPATDSQGRPFLDNMVMLATIQVIDGKITVAGP